MKNETTNLQSGSSSPVKTNGKWRTPSVDQMEADIVATAKQFYGDFLEVAGEKMQIVNKRASSFIRHYPVQSATAALASGVVLGALIFRRRT